LRNLLIGVISLGSLKSPAPETGDFIKINASVPTQALRIILQQRASGNLSKNQILGTPCRGPNEAEHILLNCLDGFLAVLDRFCFADCSESNKYGYNLSLQCYDRYFCLRNISELFILIFTL
jgi:hypothetical protein